MSANHAAFNLIFRFVENYVSPVAGRISSQRHVMAIRDGFISAMPFMIVGSFLLVFAYPPFSPDTTWGFARAWLDLAKEFEGRILTPFDMTMGIMSIYICAAIDTAVVTSFVSIIRAVYELYSNEHQCGPHIRASW